MHAQLGRRGFARGGDHWHISRPKDGGAFPIVPVKFFCFWVSFSLLLDPFNCLRDLFSSFFGFQMDDLLSYDAILFPSDGRPPQVVELPTNPLTRTNPQTGQLILVSVMPHPEVHMDTIADLPNQRAWRVQLVESLEGMTKCFANPYIVFYPVVSRTGAPLPINRAIREIQGCSFNENNAWRGNIVVAKYRGGGSDPFISLIDISMADFPILKNYFMNHCPYGQN